MKIHPPSPLPNHTKLAPKGGIAAARILRVISFVRLFHCVLRLIDRISAKNPYLIIFNRLSGIAL